MHGEVPYAAMRLAHEGAALEGQVGAAGGHGWAARWGQPSCQTEAVQQRGMNSLHSSRELGTLLASAASLPAGGKQDGRRPVEAGGGGSGRQRQQRQAADRPARNPGMLACCLLAKAAGCTAHWGPAALGKARRAAGAAAALCEIY